MFIISCFRKNVFIYLTASYKYFRIFNQNKTDTHTHAHVFKVGKNYDSL